MRKIPTKDRDQYMPTVKKLKTSKKVAIANIKRIIKNAEKIGRLVDYEYIWNHSKELNFGEWKLFEDRMMAGEYYCLMTDSEHETTNDAGANFYDFCECINDYRRFDAIMNAILEEEELGV